MSKNLKPMASISTSGGQQHKKPLPNLRLKIATDLLAATMSSIDGVTEDDINWVLHIADVLIRLEEETRENKSEDVE